MGSGHPLSLSEAMRMKPFQQARTILIPSRKGEGGTWSVSQAEAENHCKYLNPGKGVCFGAGGQGDRPTQVPGLLRKGRVASEGFFHTSGICRYFLWEFYCMTFDLAENFLAKTISIRLHSGMNPLCWARLQRQPKIFPQWPHS